MKARTYHCPECDGAGGSWESSSGSMNDPTLREWDCSECEGSGVIRLTDDEADGQLRCLRPWSPSRRRWTGLREPVRQDTLISLSYHRAEGVKRLRARPETFQQDLRFTMYGSARRSAMRPVDLPGQRHSAWLRDTINPILSRYVEGPR